MSIRVLPNCLAITLLCVGCSKYQYVMVESHLPKNKYNKLVLENDTFSINFWFSGKNGPSMVEIYNKMKKPLYVDWAKSSFVTNEKHYPFWSDVASVNISSKSYNTPFSRPSSQSTGTVYKAEQIGFIPPASSTKKEMNNLKNDFFILSDTTKWIDTTLMTSLGKEKGRKASFNKKNAPLQFRFFLALSTSEDFHAPIFIDTPFWVSEIMATKAEPNMVIDKPANQFYMKGLTGFGEVGYAIVGSILLIFIIAGFSIK